MAFKNECLSLSENENSKYVRKASNTLRSGCCKFAKWISIILGVGVLTSCGQVDLQWSEEVELADGQVMVVKRAAKGEKQGELGGPGGWEQTEMSLAVEKAAEGMQFPIWRTAYVPILLDYQESEETWSVVATFYYCQGWYDLGRPKLPYVEYQSKDGGPWAIVPLEQRLIGRETNLLTGPRAGGEPAFLSLRDKKGRDDNAADRFRRIVASWRENYC